MLSIPDLGNVFDDYLKNTIPQILTNRPDGIAIWKSQPIPAPENLPISEMDFKLVDQESKLRAEERGSFAKQLWQTRMKDPCAVKPCSGTGS